MPPSPDTVLQQWNGMIDNHFSTTIRKTFDLPENEDYEYKSEGFHMTLSNIQQIIDTGTFRYHYRGGDGTVIPSTKADIEAYTSIFLPGTDTTKALKGFLANAKKESPREKIANYLTTQRISPPDSIKIPRRKAEWKDPYLDLWIWSCHETGFIGPLNEPHYAHPSAARQTHPMLPVLYHHFGCVAPTWEALSIIAGYARAYGKEGVVDCGSGNGYWTFMLRRLPSPPGSPAGEPLDVVAVDNGSSNYRYTWITDTQLLSGVEYLKSHSGCPNRVLLLVYMVTKTGFTKQVLKAYKGNVIVIVGTENANRFTMFEDQTVEEYFEKEMRGWGLDVRVGVPSFAGKDEALFVYRRKQS